MIKKSLLISIFVIFYGCSSSSSMFKSDIEREKVLKLSSNYNQLINEYRQKLKDKNQDKDRLNLAKLYYETNDFNNALYYLEPMTQKGKSVDALILKALILDKNQKTQKALNALDLALKLDSKNAKAWNLKGVFLARSGNYSEAKICFLTAKEHFLDDLQVNANLGILELLNEDYISALSYFKPLYVRGYKDTKFLNSFVYSLIKNDELELAKKVVRDEGISDDFKVVLNAVSNSKINIHKD